MNTIPAVHHKRGLAQPMRYSDFVASLLAVLLLVLGLSACPPPMLPSITPSTTTVDFGDVPVGQTVTKTVNVTTHGVKNIHALLVVGPFSATDDLTSNIEDFNVQVSVTPTAAGAITGSVTIVGERIDNNTTIGARVNLKANGVASAPVSITTTSLPAGVIGTAYNQAVAATGGTQPYAFSISQGALPPGLSLDPSNGGVTGTPKGPAGMSSFTVTVKDSSNPPKSDSKSLSIAINLPPPPVITTKQAQVPSGSVGVLFPTFSFQANGFTGNGPLVFAANPPFSDNLTLNPNGSVTGTPTSTTTFSFTVTATDTFNQSSPATPFSITVSNIGIAFTQQGTPPASLNTNATFTVNAAVTGDPLNGGVDWSLFCGSVGACGGFGTPPAATAHTASGTGILYTAPAAIPTGANVTITAASHTQPSVTTVATVAITSVGNNNGQVTGPQFLQYKGSKVGAHFIIIVDVTFTADGMGGASNVVISSNVPSFSNAGGTLTYNVDQNQNLTVTVTIPGQTDPFVFEGTFDPAVGSPMISTGTPALTGGIFNFGSANLFKQDPTAFSLATFQNLDFFSGSGNFSGQPLLVNGTWTITSGGFANNVTTDFAQPGSHETGQGNSTLSLGSPSAITGCSQGIYSFLGNVDSFQNNVNVCIVNSHLALGISLDQASASAAGDFQMTFADFTARNLAFNIRLGPSSEHGAFHPSPVTPAASSSLTGAFTALLQGFSGTGASATNSIQQAQFVTDGAGNITSGILDQNNGGTVTSSVNIAGSTITADSTTPGRFTIHLNSNGKTLIDSDFTAYVAPSGFGFVMAGTPTHPSTQLGFGIVEPQTGAPFSASSFGGGCLVSSVAPAGPADTALIGAMDFSAGITNFNSIFSFVQGGTVTKGQAITGTFTITDPNTGRFTGNLTGFPGTSGAVVGYLNGPNLFNFALSTSSTSSALVLCIGQ